MSGGKSRQEAVDEVVTDRLPRRVDWLKQEGRLINNEEI